MSADNERRARELLADELRAESPAYAAMIAAGDELLTAFDRASLRAIMAALDEPAGSTDSYRLSPISVVEPAADEAVACRAAIKGRDGLPRGPWVYQDVPEYYSGLSNSDITIQKLYTRPPVAVTCLIGELISFVLHIAACHSNPDGTVTIPASVKKQARLLSERADNSELTYQSPPVAVDDALRALVAKWRSSQPLIADYEAWAAHAARCVCADELEAALGNAGEGA